MRFCALILLSFFTGSLFSQANQLPGQRKFKWPDGLITYKEIPDSFKNEEAVILKEELVISENLIKRKVAFKLLKPEAISSFRKILLPESFDLTNFPNSDRQGRFKHLVTPYIYEYKLQHFSARIIKPNNSIVYIPVNFNVEEFQRVSAYGRREKDYVYNFQLEQAEPGDILEYDYEAIVNWKGVQNVIYPHGKYPKLDYNLKLIIHSNNKFDKIKLAHNHLISDKDTSISVIHNPGNDIKITLYHLENLKGVYYPNNSAVGSVLPNISVNTADYPSVRLNGQNSNVRSYLVFDRYSWIIFLDTTGKKRVYTKEHANVKKFLEGIPRDPQDSTGILFTNRLTDTLNKLKFLTNESIYTSGDHSDFTSVKAKILQGILPEGIVKQNYDVFLEQRNIFYYDVKIIDKRLSAINPLYRNHAFLEKEIIGIPIKNTVKYYTPRIGGVTYFPDELPFYFENTGVALTPCYGCRGNSKKVELLFATTPKSTFNDNTRSESASFRIITDSLKIHGSIKENLSGQFSTVLRHLYNGQAVDSTIPSNYFKKCISKPGTSEAVVKLISANRSFPFKHSYACGIHLSITSKTEIDLTNWFSFFWDKNSFPKTPNHDFYVDFQFSDAYNYLFEFDKPVEILNMTDFSQKLSNEFFEASSNFVKQEANKYLLSIVIKVKQDKLPVAEAKKLSEFTAMLDQLNHLKINYKIL